MATVNKTGLSALVSYARKKTPLDSGYCYSFDGIDGKITHSATQSFLSTDNATVCGRVKPTVDATDSFGSQVIVKTKWFYVHIRRISGIDKLIVRFDNGSARQAGTLATPKNYWYNFVADIKYNADTGNTTARIYINEQTFHVITSTKPTSSSDDYIGSNGTSYFTGKMDDIMIFKRTLTDDERLGYMRGNIPSLNNCVFYATAEEGGGTVAVDRSNSGNNGTISGGVTFAADKVFSIPSRTAITNRFKLQTGTQKSIYENGSSYITCPITPSVDGFSLGFWIRLNSLPTGSNGYVYYSNNGNGGFFIVHLSPSTRKYRFSIFNGSAEEANIQTQSIMNVSWNFIVATYKPNEAKLYINNVLVGTDVSCQMTNPSSAQEMTIGGYSYNHSIQRPIMNIKNFTFQNTTTPWTQAQIDDLYWRNIIPEGAKQWSMNDVATDQNGENALTLSGTSYSTNVPPHMGSRTAI